ncbi:protein E55E [Elephant endotheliotropic herpesvirus 2]|nr:protein E55E [Elephant endotheliotropic herpesvirus 2]
MFLDCVMNISWNMGIFIYILLYLLNICLSEIYSLSATIGSNVTLQGLYTNFYVKIIWTHNTMEIVNWNIAENSIKYNTSKYSVCLETEFESRNIKGELTIIDVQFNDTGIYEFKGVYTTHTTRTQKTMLNVINTSSVTKIPETTNIGLEGSKSFMVSSLCEQIVPLIALNFICLFIVHIANEI